VGAHGWFHSRYRFAHQVAYGRGVGCTVKTRSILVMSSRFDTSRVSRSDSTSNEVVGFVFVRRE